MSSRTSLTSTRNMVMFT